MSDHVSHVRIPWDALDCAETPQERAAVALLFIHSDHLRHRGFRCAVRYLQALWLMPSRKQSEALLARLVDAGHVRIEAAGTRASSRKVSVNSGGHLRGHTRGHVGGHTDPPQEPVKATSRNTPGDTSGDTSGDKYTNPNLPTPIDRAAPAPVPQKSKSSKKSKAKRKPAPKVPGYRETIEHWEASTAPWVQAPATRYPWVFHGRDHDGSKIKRWLKASQSLEHLQAAVTRYVAAVKAGTTWPKGEPPSTRHFDRELARWLMASPAPAPRDHWMDTGHGVGQDGPTPARLDTSTAQQARAWLDSPEGAALLFIVDQEFGPGALPDHDHPPRELWLDGQVTHPAVVWAELRRRRSAPPLVVVSS